MKKRQQKNQGLTIDFLQRKYQQEKQILSKQNKRLTEQLNIEIERYNELESRMDKNSRVKNEKLEELQRENQILQAKILEMERQEESVSELEVETLTEHKQLFTENQRLINEMEELQNTLLNMNNELSTLEQKLQLKQEEQKEITQNFKLLAEKHEKFKKESQNQIDRLVQENALLVEQRQKIAGKVADQKRRKKDLQKKIGELQKIVNNIKQEQNRLEQEIEDIKTEKEKQSQKNIELNMKLSLYQPKITNLENFIAKLEQEAKQQQKKIANQREINEQLRIKLEKTSKEIRHYQSEITLLRQQCNKLETQLQKSNLSKEEWIKAIRQNETEELIGLIKGGYSQCSQKQLKKGIESMHNRQSGSQSQLQLFNRIQQNQDKTLERMKLQNQINSLQVQIGQYRKQLQNLNYQLNKSKRIVEDKSLDIERKESQIRQWRIRAERLQSDRNKELATLRNQNQLLKSRDTQRLQKAKQFDEYETAMSLKLAFYERKIKEHLDTIDRKQTIIQKLQMHRNQFEDKQKNYDQNMQKLSEEVDFLRRFKQDCNRKDQLLKDYKAKLQKSKQELQQLKNEVFQLKKDKHRLQKQVQSKEQYINSLKAKQQKQQPEKIEDNTKDNKLKELKMNYQGKIRNLKKEKDDMSTGLREVRITVMNKVEEIVARHIPVAKKKTQEYEAAKLLGIKPGELDEFLNPGSAMNRKIAQQLQQLWLQQSYSQFIIRFTSYIQKHNSSTELKKQL